MSSTAVSEMIERSIDRQYTLTTVSRSTQHDTLYCLRNPRVVSTAMWWFRLCYTVYGATSDDGTRIYCCLRGFKPATLARATGTRRPPSKHGNVECHCPGPARPACRWNPRGVHRGAFLGQSRHHCAAEHTHPGRGRPGALRAQAHRALYRSWPRWMARPIRHGFLLASVILATLRAKKACKAPGPCLSGQARWTQRHPVV